MVRPHLEYAVNVWMPYERNKIDSIERIQKRATKLVRTCKHLSYENRLMLLQLPSLMYRRVRGDMIQVFKMLCMNDGFNVPKPNFNKPTYMHTRGHKYRLQKGNFKLNIRKYYFTNRIVDLWNSFPERLVSCGSIFEFERGLDEYWTVVPWKYDYEKFVYR